MKTATYTIRGTTPMMMHNERLANPFDDLTKAIKAISGKRKKTEDDLIEMSRIEWLGGLYSIDSDKPVLQTSNSDGSSPDLPVTMHDTPLDHARTLFLAIALVAFAGCVGLIVMAVLR